MKRLSHRVTAGCAVAMMMTGALIGCDPDVETESQAQPECQPVDADGEDYCVVQKSKIIIETGYICPSMLQYQYEFEGPTELGGDLIVCSSSTIRPTIPVIDVLRRKLFADSGADVCADISADYSAAVDALDTSCTQTSDCQSELCRDAPTGPICGLVTGPNTDTSVLDDFEAQHDLLSCGERDGCASVDCAGVTLECVAGECVNLGEDARTCESLDTDYNAAVAAVDKSCAQASDCQTTDLFVCGTSPASEQCGVIANANADRSALEAIEQSLEDASCNPDPSTCGDVDCPPVPLDCVAGECVLQGDVIPICDDIEIQYQDELDTLERSCVEASDCKLITHGTLCTSVGELGDQCGSAVAMSEDGSELDTLSASYTNESCGEDPLATCGMASCASASVDCVANRCEIVN